MRSLMIAGLGDARRGFGAALKLLWPLAASYLLLLIVSGILHHLGVLDGDNGIMGYSILILCLVVYAFFVLCQGAVGWHRRLLLGKRRPWAPPIPGLRAFHYALAVAAFGVFLVIAHFGASIVAGPFLRDAFVSFPDLDSMTSPVEMSEAIRLATRPLQIIFFLISLGATLALLTAGEAWLFIFPHISVDTGHVAFRHIRHSLHPPIGLIPALTIVGLLPSFIWLIYDLFVPMSIHFRHAS